MNVLIACEESQRTCIEFRRLGHNAFSCDILDCSGGHMEWHIQQDVIPLLNGFCEFTTSDGTLHRIDDRWDLIIAHPPCTNLCSAGQHWFSRGLKDPALREEAYEFFMKFVHADCDKIAIENPVGIISSRYRKYDQMIQPYQFGDPYTKRTCLWLKNLPPLVPTDIIPEPEGGWKNKWISKDGRYHGFVNYDDQGKVLAWNNPETARVRSKTYPGIAKAFAEQYGGDIRDGEIDGITRWK